MTDGRPGSLGRMEVVMFPQAGHFLPGASGYRVRTNHFVFFSVLFFSSDEKQLLLSGHDRPRKLHQNYGFL